jgi:hypothetical protein
VQFSKESIHRTDADPRPLKEKFLSSAFLADFRRLAQETTRGCIVLERPDLLKKLVEAHGAADATARQTALAELDAMVPRTSQYNPASEIPEKNLFYRLAKRLFFNDFGVYAGHDARHAQASAPAVQQQTRSTQSHA